jgi:hypothetical protein
MGAANGSKWFHTLVVMGASLTGCGGSVDVPSVTDATAGPTDAGDDTAVPPPTSDAADAPAPADAAPPVDAAEAIARCCGHPSPGVMGPCVLDDAGHYCPECANDLCYCACIK